MLKSFSRNLMFEGTIEERLSGGKRKFWAIELSFAPDRRGGFRIPRAPLVGVGVGIGRAGV